jgi:hypothetical protein
VRVRASRAREQIQSFIISVRSVFLFHLLSILLASIEKAA